MKAETEATASESPEAAGKGMIQRIGALLTTPRAEWVLIAAEPMTVRQVLLGWAAPLAAIGPAAKLIGSQLLRFGSPMPPRFASALTEAVLGYILSLGAIYVLSLVVNGLAVTFNGKRDHVRALKLSAYGATAAYLAGALEIWPRLAWLEIAGLYSLYLIFAGLPILMHVPRKRAFVYTVVTMLTGLTLTILLTLVVSWSKDMFTSEVPASAWNYTPPG